MLENPLLYIICAGMEKVRILSKENKSLLKCEHMFDMMCIEKHPKRQMRRSG